MDRYALFLTYYRLLTDFIIFHELLFRRNSHILYPKLVYAHKLAMVDGDSMADDEFKLFVGEQTVNLLIHYARVVEHYLTVNSSLNFKLALNANKYYIKIVSDINAARNGANLDVQELVNNINAIERDVPYFTAPVVN